MFTYMEFTTGLV